MFDADASGSMDFSEFTDMLIAMSEAAEVERSLHLLGDSSTLAGRLIDVEEEPSPTGAGTACTGRSRLVARKAEW